MAELIDVIGYFCQNYPFPEELSQARLTKMVYLADWKNAITEGAQITSIHWVFNHYGPYVEDVINAAKADNRFKVVDTVNYYGAKKFLIKFFKKDSKEFPSLKANEKNILDFVISKTSTKYWKDFMNLIYSTYPIYVSKRGEYLDLVQLAQKYKNEAICEVSL